jgi:hypothetical protein
MDFNNPANLKFLKKFNLTIIGSVSATTVLNWGYDYTVDYTKQSFASGLNNPTQAEYNVSEYNTTAEYTTGVDIQLPEVAGTGSGTVVTVGVESTINNAPYSIQKLDIHALLGRLL